MAISVMVLGRRLGLKQLGRHVPSFVQVQDRGDSPAKVPGESLTIGTRTVEPLAQLAQ